MTNTLSDGETDFRQNRAHTGGFVHTHLSPGALPRGSLKGKGFSYCSALDRFQPGPGPLTYRGRTHPFAGTSWHGGSRARPPPGGELHQATQHRLLGVPSLLKKLYCIF